MSSSFVMMSSTASTRPTCMTEEERPTLRERVAVQWCAARYTGLFVCSRRASGSAPFPSSPAMDGKVGCCS